MSGDPTGPAGGPGAAEGVLRRGRAGGRHRRAGVAGPWFTGLRSARNRPQQARRRRVAPPGRPLRRGRRRDSGRRRHRVQRPRRVPKGRGRCRRARSSSDRRDLSAGEPGAQRSQALRGEGLRDRPHRALRAPRGRGNDGTGARSGAPGVEPGRRRVVDAGESGEARLRDPDHAQRRRHPGDHRGARGALSAHPRSRRQGHLLCHAEPADRGAAAGGAVRRDPGDRRRLQLELQPAAGDRRRGGDREPSHPRRRQPGSRVARRGADGGNHRRGIGPGIARAGPDRSPARHVRRHREHPRRDRGERDLQVAARAARHRRTVRVAQRVRNPARKRHRFPKRMRGKPAVVGAIPSGPSSGLSPVLRRVLPPARTRRRERRRAP